MMNVKVLCSYYVCIESNKYTRSSLHDMYYYYFTIHGDARLLLLAAARDIFLKNFSREIVR